MNGTTKALRLAVRPWAWWRVARSLSRKQGMTAAECKLAVIHDLCDVLERHWPHPKLVEPHAWDHLMASVYFYARICIASKVSEEDAIRYLRDAYGELKEDEGR
jgi:hypothetical protein